MSLEQKIKDRQLGKGSVYRKTVNKQDKLTKKQIKNIKSETNIANEQLTGDANTLISQQDQAFQGSLDVNAVNEKIQRRQIREYMSNTGLSQSGYNDVSQAGVSVSKMNNDSAVLQAKNAQISSIRANLQASIQQNNTATRQNVNSVRMANDQNKIALYQQYGDTQGTLESIRASVASTTDKASAAQMAAHYQGLYGLDENDIKSLLAGSPITFSQYQKWQKDKSVFDVKPVVSGGGSRSSGRSSGSSSSSSYNSLAKVTTTVTNRLERYQTDGDFEGMSQYLNQQEGLGKISPEQRKQLEQIYGGGNTNTSNTNNELNGYHSTFKFLEDNGVKPENIYLMTEDEFYRRGGVDGHKDYGSYLDAEINEALSRRGK